jgi:hypothetical protein
MTNDISDSKQDGPKWGKFALSMVAGAFAGAVGSALVLALMDGGLFGDIGKSETIALMVAAVYVFIAIGVGVGAASPSFGTRFLNVEDADELREQQQSLIASAIAMLAIGLVLGVIAVAGPGGAIPSMVGAIVAGILFVVSVIFGIRSMKFADELMNAVNRETGSTAYYMIFVVVGGWAALAHLELLAAPRMLDLLSLFWVIGLFATFWATGKRGMLSPR